MNVEFNDGWVAAGNDLHEGWFTVDLPDSLIRNMVVMNGGYSETFADGYLARVKGLRALAEKRRSRTLIKIK